MAERPQEGEWKRDLVNRYQTSGWVDAEGNPSPELERALAPLRAAGVAIANAPALHERKIGVVVSKDAAGGLVKASGFGGGWFLRPFSADRATWPARFRELFSEKDYPFEASSYDGHYRWMEPAHEDLARAVGEGDVSYARAYAGRHGFDGGALASLAQAVRNERRGCARYQMYVCDYTGCEADYTYGWRWLAGGKGPLKARRALVVPAAGAVFSDCNAWHTGVPYTWMTEVAKWRDATAFYALDFYPAGDLFEAVSSACAYPSDEGEKAGA